MSERTDNPLPSGQIFFENRWTRAAAVVFGIPAVIAPIACAPQAAYVQPASASELGAETIELTATQEPISIPDFKYQSNFSNDWVKVDHTYFLSGKEGTDPTTITIYTSDLVTPEQELERQLFAFDTFNTLNKLYNSIDITKQEITDNGTRIELEYNVILPYFGLEQMGNNKTQKVKQIFFINQDGQVVIAIASIPTHSIKDHEALVQEALGSIR